MAFQKEVGSSQALGQAGDFYDASLRRVTAYNLTSITSKTPSIGKVFTFEASGQPVLGGTGKFAGILIHPKAHARLWLEPTMALPSGCNAELADAGRVVVETTVAASATSGVQYDTKTGDITGPAPKTPTEGMAVIPNATFFLFDAKANGLAVVQLGNTMTEE